MKSFSLEIFLQAIIEQSNDFVIAVDEEMTLRAFNKAAFVLFKEFGFELCVGARFWDILQSFPQQRTNAQRALNGERFSSLEAWKSKFFQTEYTPLYDFHAEKIGALLIGRVMHTMWNDEIAQYSQLELAKEEKEFFWPPTIVYGRGRDSQSFFRQPSWESFTGQTFEEYDGFGYLNAYHPDFRPRVQRMWEAVRDRKKPSAFSFLSDIWNAKLNMYRHTLIHSTPQYDRQGNVSYWTCAGIDIHELLQNQEQLVLATQRLNCILEAGQIGTWDWDLDTGIITSDNVFNRLFGSQLSQSFDAKSLMNQVIDFASLENVIDRTIHTGVPYDTEFQIWHPDRSLHWIRSRGEVHLTKDGRKLLHGVAWDITSSKEMQEERIRFGRSIGGELIAADLFGVKKRFDQASRLKNLKERELKKQKRIKEDKKNLLILNPLVGIYGGVHLATEELDRIQGCNNYSVENIRSRLDSILKCAEQQKILVDDVLDMSKLQNNKIELVPEPFQLSACFELMVDMFRSTVQEKNLKLTTEVAQDVFVKADVKRLQQVIINLVSNAVKFTQEGKIHITAQLNENDMGDESTLKIQVQDTGIGITEDDIPYLFDRFSQAKTSHKRTQYGGTGLGLAISKRLVEAMGGQIFVESTIGVGSKFSFHIKVEQVGPDNTQLYQGLKKPKEKCECANKDILVVDDSTLNQKILSTYLEKAGHSVQVASDGYEALQKAAQQHFDIIFMDIEMPNMNGLEATVALRQREQELNIRSAIIGLSGNARKEKIDAAMEAGMDFYITKPYHKDDIMKVIAMCVQSIKLSRVRKQSTNITHRLSKQQKCEQ